MKRKLLFAIVALLCSVGTWAQASFNHAYTSGATVAAGGDYFLYNIGAGQFLTSGLNWGTRATVDNSGRVLTLAAATNGYSIATNHVSLNERTDAKAGFLTTNGYVDSGSNDADWVFTSVSVGGYTNAYTIKNSDTQYLYFNASDCAVNVGESTGDNNSYWLLIPKGAREAAGDYSHYLINTQMNCPWELKTWSGSTANNSDVIAVGGNETNRCGEKYHAAVDIYQNVKETVPNGRYKFSAQGFWRQDGSAAGPVLYANSDSETLAGFNAKGEGTEANMAGASTSFSAGYYVNSVETFVSNGSLKVGINITDGSQWVIFDNFVLDYLGQCVMDYATALPISGDMAADTWYYFDINAAADNYEATATTLGDIICTDDGYALITTSGNVTLTATDNSLAVKRYYVKSSSANNLVVAPAAFSYTVGSATPSIADGAYIGSLTTVDFVFASATSNDPGATFAILNGSATASLKLGGSEVTTGTLSLAGTTLTATFSDVALTLSSTYTIEIASGVVGYEGEASNAAISTTFNTGIIADGVYYFKKKGEYKYLTRGGYYGTETVVDNYGISFETQIQSDGKYYMKNVDHSLAANTDKYLNAYTDQGAYGWTIAAASGGYYMKDVDGKYLTTTSTAYTDDNGNTNTYYYQSRTTIEGDAIIWNILTKSEYAASLTAKKNAEIAALATSASIDGVTTLSELETLLSESYLATDKTSEISNALCNSASDWTAVSYNAGSKYTAIDYHAPTIQIYNCCGGITQTISSLPAGLYKVTVSATWRPGNSTDATRVGNEANTTAWIYANDNITQLKGWYEGGGTINTTQGLVDNAASYLNTVYVYVDGTEDLKIGLAVPSFCQQNWCPIYNWTLTYYEAKATSSEKSALAAAISAAEAKTLGFETGEYAPYNNVAALEALAAAKAIDPETASGAAVVSATTTLTGATWTKNNSDVDAIYNGDFSDGQGSAAANIQEYGWTRTNGWGQFKNDADATSTTNQTAYYNQPGSLQYGNAGVYTMPLKANTIYTLTFKYASWEANSNNGLTASVLNSSDGMAAVAFDANKTQYQEDGAFVTKTIRFVTGAAGNYVLTLANSGNTVMTDVSLVKAASQTLTLPSATQYAAGTYPTIALDRTFASTSNWYTLCVPFDFPKSAFAEVKVMNAVTDAGASSNITFTDASSTIAAGTPCLVKPASADYTLSVTNTAIDPATTPADDAEVTNGTTTVTYVGTFTSVALNGDDNSNAWIVKDNNLYHVASNVTVGAYRAYFTVETGDSNVKSFFLDFGDADAISGLTPSPSPVGEGSIYNLAGQKMSKLQKGVNIVNGKKLIVK